ncbi:MAG TPA: RMD1 family protein [Cyclobacteriaceae bacterium]
MQYQLMVSALQVAAQFDIKAIKAAFQETPLAESTSEMYYQVGNNRFEYICNYGTVVFCGFTEEEIEKRVGRLAQYTRQLLPNRSRDDYYITLQVDQIDPQFEFHKVSVNHLDETVIRIAMLNLAQSVVLDRYHELTENLLLEIKGISRNLEQTGRLKLSQSKIMKFIGRALNTQNDIAENIYVFDSPEMVWNDEYLDKLHQGLKKYFDLRSRFSEIEFTNQIIKDNLIIFRDISSQRQSNLLEIIIIILILAEVFDLILTKFF